MTLQEIAIFKRFIGQHELRKNFIKKYRNSVGITRNPESIEKYLSNVEPTKVITSAIKHFITNEAMGYEFWQSVNESWLQYLEKMRSSHTIEQENPVNLRGYFSALRENWDKDKPWVYDPISVAQLRYGIITPEEVGITGEDKEDVKEVPAEIQDVDFEEETAEQPDPLADFDFFEPQDRQWTKLNRGDASINFRSGSFKITFNKYDSEDAVSRNIACAKISKSKSTGDICLVFAKEGMLQNASRVTYATNGRKGKNLTINSKDICFMLHDLLNLKQDYTILCVEQLQSTPDYLIYKLSVK
jgi:hypothetical protein